MDWTAVGTIALAIATFALVIETYQTMKDTGKQSEIQKKKKELMGQEEVFNKFMGIKVSMGLEYQYRNRLNARETLAGYSKETTEKVHDAWLMAIIQSYFRAEKEFSIFTRDLWETFGLIQTRFENTTELTRLISNVQKVQDEYLEKFIYTIPPEGLNLEEIDEWARQLENNFPEFDKIKLDPALGNVLGYLRNEINKRRTELAQMKG